MVFKGDKHRRWWFANKKNGTLPSKKKTSSRFDVYPFPFRVSSSKAPGGDYRQGPVTASGLF